MAFLDKRGFVDDGSPNLSVLGDFHARGRLTFTDQRTGRDHVIRQDAVNVFDFGATGDGVTDDTTAIQAAMDATPQFGLLTFPSGTFRISRPIRMTKAFTMRGEGGHNTGGLLGQTVIAKMFELPVFHGPIRNGWTGPALIIGGEGPTFATGMSGSFSFVTIPVTSTTNGIVLSESDMGAIGGLGVGAAGTAGSGFTFECWISAHGHSFTNEASVAVSQGRRSALDSISVDRAFALELNLNNVVARLKTTSGSVSVTSNIPLPATLTHVAATYDQANFKLYISGTLAGTMPITGTIVQQPWEDFVIGNSSGQWPFNSSAVSVESPFDLASIRLSNYAVYTGPFTPSSTELSVQPGAKTICSMNFKQSDLFAGGSWVVAHSAQGAGRGGGSDGIGDPVYVFLGHQQPLPTDNFPTVSDISFYASNGFNGAGEGVYVHSMNFARFNDVTINDNAKGITFAGGYGHVLDRMTIGIGSIERAAKQNWCLGFTDNGGGISNKISDSVMNGGMVSIVSNAGFNAENILINNCPSLMGAYACGAIADGAAVRLVNCVWDDEGQQVSDSGFYVSGMTSVYTDQCIWPGSGVSTCVQYKIGACGDTLFRDQYNLVDAACPGLVHFTSAMVDNSVVTLASPYNSQNHLTPIIDPAAPGPVIVPQQEQFGTRTKNFASDADLTLSGDDQLWGFLDVTDSAVHLTMARNVVFPYLTAGYRRLVTNDTAQSLTFKGPSGSGVSVGAGKTATVRCNGASWLRVTPDV